MEIRKLFGQQEAVAAKADAKKKSAVEQYEQSSAGAAQRRGEDVVSVSSLSRSLLSISNVLDEDAAKRADRVADLKRRVADGEYSVDSSDVARSIISFAVDQPGSTEL